MEGHEVETAADGQEVMDALHASGAQAPTSSSSTR